MNTNFLPELGGRHHSRGIGTDSPDFNSQNPNMLSMLQSGLPKYYEKDYTRVGEIKRRIDYIKYKN